MSWYDRYRQIHDAILRRGTTGAYRQRYWTNPATGRRRDLTFCNYAVLEGLERLRINTTGLRAGRHPGPTARNIRQDAYSANTMFDYMYRQSLRPNGNWLQIYDNSLTQRLANFGVTAVAGYRNPTRGRSGHVALVRPGPNSWVRNSSAPYLSNVGERATTGVIPHTESHGSSFRFFMNRNDPGLDRIMRLAESETRPNFIGPPSPSTSWMKNALRTTYRQTRPSFVGPPSPTTQLMANLGIFERFHQETRPNFVGPPCPSTRLLQNLGFR
jgi:hypothetical protein